MRTRRLCGLALAVVAAHLLAWKIAASAIAAAPVPRTGVHWLELLRSGPGAAGAMRAARPAAKLADSWVAPSGLDWGLRAEPGAAKGTGVGPGAGTGAEPIARSGKGDGAKPVADAGTESRSGRGRGPGPVAGMGTGTGTGTGMGTGMGMGMGSGTPATAISGGPSGANTAPQASRPHDQRRPPVRLAAGAPPAAPARASAPARRAGPGVPGSARARPDAPTWPVYPTRAPPSTSLDYILVHGGSATPVRATGAASAAPFIDSASASAPLDGGATARARLDWRVDGDAFALRVSTLSATRAPQEWRSDGGFDAAGVAPLRLVEREHGRDRRSINFDRAGHRVRFSAATQSLAFAPGTQDRWSWIPQLAAIAEAASLSGRRPIRAGTTWQIQVAGLHGELERWVFRVQSDNAPPADRPRNGDSVFDAPWRAPSLLHVLREPERPYDLRIEAWLLPALHFLPAGLRMSTPPGTWAQFLWLSTSVAPAAPSQM